MRSARGLAAALALLAATLWVHAPRSAGFVYDDRDFVVANQSIRSAGETLRAMLLPFPPEQPQRGLYRPLTNLSYALDYAAWRGEALGFHGTNVALYAATVLLVATLAAAYLGSVGFGFAVALLFAVHPVHCDAVDAVAGRSELLALLFSLASLLLFLRAAPRPSGHRPAVAASALFYALACLSKETGAVVLAVLAAHALVLGPPGRGWRARLLPLRAHAGVLLVYLALRAAVLGRFSPEAAILRDHDLATRLYTIATVFLVDLKLLVWPNLEVDYFYQAAVPIPERPTAAALLGGVLLLGAVAGALALCRRHFRASPDEDAAQRRVRAAALCALAFFFATWLPTSHVFDFGALLAERFLFAPSLGFLVLAVLAARSALARIPARAARRPAAVALLAALALAWGLRSQARAAEWRDPVRLWSAASRSLPRDVRVLSNLAGSHLERGEIEPARRALERAFAVDPAYAPALGNLAVLQFGEGRLDEAAATYRRILELDAADFLAWYNLGLIEAKRENHSEAAQHFRRSLALNPNFSFARQGLEVSERALRDARTLPGQGPK